jgi:hypothetical protein
MKSHLEFQLELLLKEWQQGLLELDFVGDLALDTLKKRLVRFIDRNVHISEDDELHQFVTDHDHFIGG